MENYQNSQGRGTRLIESMPWPAGTDRPSSTYIFIYIYVPWSISGTFLGATSLTRVDSWREEICYMIDGVPVAAEQRWNRQCRWDVCCQIASGKNPGRSLPCQSPLVLGQATPIRMFWLTYRSLQLSLGASNNNTSCSKPWTQYFIIYTTFYALIVYYIIKIQKLAIYNDLWVNFIESLSAVEFHSV